MTAFLSWRLWAAIALAAGLAFTHFTAYRSGKAVVRAEWTAEKLKQTAAALVATEAARAKDRALQDTVTKAQHEARIRETKLALDARNLRRERDGLRDDLATSQRELPGASCESVRKRAATLTDVFDQCSGAIEDLAGKADRHASDALTFEQAWPK